MDKHTNESQAKAWQLGPPELLLREIKTKKKVHIFELHNMSLNPYPHPWKTPQPYFYMYLFSLFYYTALSASSACL